MEKERDEVYERIPWEHLDKQSNDRQWLLVGVAGALALGALAYSFMKNQPVEAPEAALSVEQPAATVDTTTSVASTATAETVSSPVVISEADLFAVDPEHLAEMASSHAEWFAVEFFSVDGSDESADTLRSLLPEGVPLPEAPTGTQVFVDWVGTRTVTQTGDFDFEVEVLVRSLVSTPESGFIRQPVTMLGVDVSIGDDGEPRITSVPRLLDVSPAASGPLELIELPEEIQAATAGSGAAIGGIQRPDGGWRVLVMVTGSDGVKRPVMVDVP